MSLPTTSPTSTGPGMERAYCRRPETSSQSRRAKKLADARWDGLKTTTHPRYRASASRYTNICLAANISPWPATAESLELFAVTLGRSLLPSSVTTELGRIRLFSAANGLSYPPRSATAGLRLILRGLERRSWRATKRATPLRACHLTRFTNTLDLSSFPHLRLAAMLWLSHSALLRSVEMLHLRWSDVDITEFGLRVYVHPQFDKTALGPTGSYVWVPATGTRAWSLLKSWQARQPQARDSDLVWGSIGYRSWLRAVKSVGRRLGLTGVTTHALRAGGCTDLLEGGASHELVKRIGRWKSDCFLQYWRPEPVELTAHLAAAFQAAAVKRECLSHVFTRNSSRQAKAKKRREARARRRVRWAD